MYPRGLGRRGGGGLWAASAQLGRQVGTQTRRHVVLAYVVLLLPPCVSLCILRCSERLKVLPQTGQVRGVWVLSCTSRRYARGNLRSHTRHTYDLPPSRFVRRHTRPPSTTAMAPTITPTVTLARGTALPDAGEGPGGGRVCARAFREAKLRGSWMLWRDLEGHAASHSTGASSSPQHSSQQGRKSRDGMLSEGPKASQVSVRGIVIHNRRRN